jgi:FKBP-type peptidyl-prolyl cis-trans isomerase 2
MYLCMYLCIYVCSILTIVFATTAAVSLKQLIPGLEERVVGMKVGEVWEGSLPPDQSFGLPVEDRVFSIDRSQHPNDEIVIGQNVQLSDNTMGKVIALTDEIITVDGNHPLAGEECEFKFEIISVDKEVEQAWSGVRVKTIEQGDGATFPTTGDVVQVSYEGTLATNGKMFDASDKPLKFTLGIGQVIKGWDIGISKMSVSVCTAALTLELTSLF